MPAMSWKSFAFVSALALTVPAGALGASAAIECSKIGLAYDGLFVDANKRVQDVLAEYKALAASATEQQKDAVRKKFCAVGGELVGYYKFVQAMANDCAKQGEKMDQLLDVINKQLGLAQQGVKQPCG
jgi:hypothetical protein